MSAKKRKYNDPEDLNDLCRSFLRYRETDDGAAIEYCKNFLELLEKKRVTAGAVLSSRSRSR